MPRAAAMSQLTREHDLDPVAAENLLRYIADQEIATTAVPDDRTILIERIRDELGGWRVVSLLRLKQNSCAVGDGDHGEDSRVRRPGCRDDVVRRTDWSCGFRRRMHRRM